MGGMAQHGTSVPSADRATNACGSDKRVRASNGLVRSVTRVSGKSPRSDGCPCCSSSSALLRGSGWTSSSGKVVGVLTAMARVPPAQSHVLTQRSPSTTAKGLLWPEVATA